MEIKLSDFKIVPVIDSIRRLNIDDDVYFSDKYGDYISNSRLKYINPEEGGSSSLYKAPPHLSTTSLKVGSAVHCALLQPESFILAPKLDRPTAKLGDVVEMAYFLQKDGLDLVEAIRKACISVGYYVNQIDRKIPMIIEKGTPFWNNLNNRQSNKQQEIYLSDADHDIVTTCLQSCYDSKIIMEKLHPTDIFGNPIESYNEIAFFIDFIVTYKDKQYTTLKFKMKADNYTVDESEKLITLNDLKTTSHLNQWFMHPEYGSMAKYHYYRQMYLYNWLLWIYCGKKYGASKDAGWRSEVNMLVVQTTPDYVSMCHSVNKQWLQKGKIEAEQLLKRIAAYQIFGWNSQINFI